jgi:hypothetical protein
VPDKKKLPAAPLVQTPAAPPEARRPLRASVHRALLPALAVLPIALFGGACRRESPLHTTSLAPEIQADPEARPCPPKTVQGDPGRPAEPDLAVADSADPSSALPSGLPSTRPIRTAGRIPSPHVPAAIPAPVAPRVMGTVSPVGLYPPTPPTPPASSAPVPVGGPAPAPPPDPGEVS